jgi:hypothetical protein
VMAVRWVGVYRAGRTAAREAADGPPDERRKRTLVTGDTPVAVLEQAPDAGPPERNFPLPVVIAHGVFAAATLTLVLLTALGVGGS